ncbi:hypothetical protein [Burkholderia diffusa]|uniref:hypothetical protein n=1 Tax=Burkholderia diffusa TaxID=488732 RepID=UPI000758A644|nr:hypothetical protein [Burkholderia diffusa]
MATSSATQALEALMRACDARELPFRGTPAEVLASIIKWELDEQPAQADAQAEALLTGWQPIETAPADVLVTVFWLDSEDETNPERYDFDMLDDGCWRVWTDHYEFAHSVAPAGSRMPREQPPYTHWKPLGVPADAARAQGGNHANS